MSISVPGPTRRYMYPIEPLRTFLRRYRDDRQMTNKEMGELLGIAESTFETVINRRRREHISETLVERYLAVLGYSIYDLYGKLSA